MALVGLERAQKTPHCHCDCQSKRCIWYQNPREEKKTDTRAQHQPGIKTGFGSKSPPAEPDRDPTQQDDGQDEGQTARPVVYAKETERGCDHPVVQRGLFKISDAVETRRNPIAGLKHVAGDLRLHGIDIIHKMRGAECAAKEDGGGDKDNDQVRLETVSGDGETSYSGGVDGD